MANPDLGTKRICPETGRKFYDLNKDPIVSPYTGQSYPRSFFDITTKMSVVADEEDEEEKEVDLEDEGAELVSLEDADDEAKGEEIPLDDDDDDVDLGDDDDDTFLADDEDDEDDVTGMISVGDDDDEG